MTYYTKILHWENENRIGRLIEFRELLIEYFKNSHVEWGLNERIEDQKAQEARSKINRMMGRIHAIILASGVNPALQYTPPRAIGGYIQNIDIIENIFNLTSFQISPNSILDFIDRSIGVYEGNSGPALRRTINPFFYFSLAFDLLAAAPFIFIGRVGFDRHKAEQSLLGHILKAVIYIIGALASFLTVLQLLDLLEVWKAFTIDLFHQN
jgi:hypothetical protein